MKKKLKIKKRTAQQERIHPGAVHLPNYPWLVRLWNLEEIPLLPHFKPLCLPSF